MVTFKAVTRHETFEVSCTYYKQYRFKLRTRLTVIYDPTNKYKNLTC